MCQLHLPPVPRRAGGARSHPEQFRARRGLQPDDARWYAAARLAAIGALARLPPAEASWRPLGPFYVPHGQVTGAGARPGVVGPVADVAVDPADPEHLLAGAATGGVWETRDGGRAWRARTDGQPSLAVGAIAFAPSDPAVAYAGTGEGDALPELGVGVLRSADGGASWELVGGGDLLGVGFSALLVDPGDPGRLLAATTAGVLLSADAGATWARRLPGPAWDLSAGPAGEVLAGCRAGLCRSTDAGVTWELVGLPSEPSAFERVAVCCAPGGQLAYAFAAGDGVGHLWRRERGGPFEAVRPPADLQTRQARAGWVAAAGGGEPETLWLGAAGLHRGVRGPDGRWSWVDLSARPAGDRVPAFQRAVAVAGGVVWVAGEGGLHRSADLGRTFEAGGAGLAVAEVGHLAGRPGTGAWLLAGAGGLGTIRYEGTETWFLADEGGGPVAADPDAPGACWHARPGSGVVRSGRGGSWGSWSPEGDGPADLDDGSEPPLSARAGVVAVGGGGLYVADAGAPGGGPGGGWVQVDLPGPPRRVTAVAVAGPARLFAGTEDGEVVRVDRAGGRWLPAGRSRPGHGLVAALAADPGRPGEVWAAVAGRPGGGRVWRSTDAGATWTGRGGGLPDVPVNAVVLDPDRPGTVLVGADVGVWRTDDAGAGWRLLAGGLPQAPALALDLQPGSGRVRAGLLGRGVWEAPLAAVPAARLHLRASRADDGRRPPPAGIPDPFGAGPTVWWWQSPDVKVAVASGAKGSQGGVAPGSGQLPADAVPAWFEDDHGVGAVGLAEAGGRVDPGRPARVWVQAHNPGASPVAGGRVRAFATAAAVGAPPAWPGFPDADPPAGGPWWPVGSPAPVGRLGAGRAGLVGLPWAVPAGTPADLTLLAVATTDPHAGGQPGVEPAPGRPAGARALKSVTVVSATRALRLELWAPAKGGRFALAAEPGAAALVEGLVLGHRLAGRARAAGRQPARLAARWRPELITLLGQDAALAGRLDLAGAFPVPGSSGPAAGPGRPEVWLDGVELDPGDPEPLVLLLAGPDRPPGVSGGLKERSGSPPAGGGSGGLKPRPPAGGGSLLQVDGGDRVVGGHTLLVPG